MQPRFIICSDLRTGSHMLATALRGHSHLAVAGEVFVRPQLFGLPAIDPDEPESVCFRRIIAAARPRFHGYVAHRWHAVALQALAEDRELRVLYLRRNGWLAELASDRIAQRTQVWHIAPAGSDYLSDDGQPVPAARPPTISVPVRVCQQFLRATRSRDAYALHLLRRHPLLHVTYEQLCADWEASLQAIQQFLELPVEAVQPVTRRQERRPLAEVVVNLAELQ